MQRCGKTARPQNSDSSRAAGERYMARRFYLLFLAGALLAPTAGWADKKDGEKQLRQRSDREYREYDERGRYARDDRRDVGYDRDLRDYEGDKNWRKEQKERDKDRREAWREAEKDRREAEREWLKDERKAEREWLKDQREAEREYEKDRRERDERYR